MGKANQPPLSPIVLEGVLKPDGTLELWGHPALPPGRVRVTLEAAPAGSSTLEVLPDPPWPEECISTPFDLPLPHPPTVVEARKMAELLPEPFEWTEADERP